MKEYITKQGSRWDSVFYDIYGLSAFNAGSLYNDFIFANSHLMDKVIFDGGEKIKIIDKQEGVDIEEIKTPFDFN